jgi:hypothetical protein
MAAKTSKDIWGTEYDWLAIDTDDRVVFFSTAGGGYAPAGFLEDTDAHEAAISAILSMPVSTAAEFAPMLGPAYVNTWQAVADRGLYAFDSDLNGSPYRLVAAPVKPARLSDLPSFAAATARRIKLSRLRCTGLTEGTSIKDSLLTP